jgi:hypothetical protein
MSIELVPINVGNIPNDGQGDPIRVAFQKCNNNFDILANTAGLTGIASGTSNIQIVQNGPINFAAANIPNVVVVSGTGATIQGQFAANGLVTVTGNVEASGFFKGDGSLLTGVVATAEAALITGTTLSPNVVSSSLQEVGALSSLTVTGTVIGGNLNSSGTISSSGNVAGLNLNTAGIVSAGGNITGGNVTTAGSMSVGGGVEVVGNVNAGFFIGDGSLLSGINVGGGDAGQLTGTTLSPNVVNSSLQTLGTLDFLEISNALGGTGNAVAGNVISNGIISAFGNITGGNLNSLGSANVITLTAQGDVVGGNISAPSGNISAVTIAATGTLSGPLLTVSGNVTGGNLNSLGGITSVGNISGLNLLGTVATPSQLLITQVGTLTSLQVTGNVTGGNLSIANSATVAANIVSGNLSVGEDIQTSRISASGNAVAGNVITAGVVSAAGNIQAASAILSGQLTASGDISGTNLVLTGAANVSGSATISGSAVINGNLTVNGNTFYTNVDELAIEDPIITLGRGPNNTPLTNNDNKDRGVASYYFDGAERIGFFGYQTSSKKLIAAEVVNINQEVVTVNQFGTFQVGTLESTAISAAGNVQAGNAIITNAVQSSVLSASGNISGANISVTTTGSIPTLTVSTLANVTATTAATSTTTGALRVAGGAGIDGNVFVGGNISTTNNLSALSLQITGNTATVTTANYAIGYRDIPSGGAPSGTLNADAGGKHFYGSGTLTIPSNSEVTLPIGTTILVVAQGPVTIAQGTGVTVRLVGTTSTGSRSLATHGMATVVKVETNVWYINGTGLT